MIPQGWKKIKEMRKAQDGIYAVKNTRAYSETHYVMLREGVVYEWGHEDGDEFSEGEPLRDFAREGNYNLFCGVHVAGEAHPLSELGSRELKLVEIAQPLPDGGEQRTVYINFGHALAPWLATDDDPFRRPEEFPSFDPPRPVVFRDVIPDGEEALPTRRFRRDGRDYEGYGEWRPVSEFPRESDLTYESRTRKLDGEFIRGSLFVRIADGWVYHVDADSDYCEPYDDFVAPSDAFTQFFRNARAVR